jgi:hypothetical protein
MMKLNDEERRALDELARHPDGCAEALLLSAGSTIRQLSGLIIDGYAGLERKRVQDGGREKTFLWMQITEAGRDAIAEWNPPVVGRGNSAEEPDRSLTGVNRGQGQPFL